MFDRKCSNIECCNILPFQGLDHGLIDFGDYIVELSWLYEMHTQEILQGTSIHGFVELAKDAYLHTYRCRAILYWMYCKSAFFEFRCALAYITIVYCGIEWNCAAINFC